MKKLLREPGAALLIALSLVGVSAAQEDMAARLQGLSGAAFEIALMQEMNREMAALKTTGGVEFDRKFAEDMIVHHQSSVEMAQLVAERAERAELKTPAQDIIGAQSREIEQMRQWLQAWGPPAPAQQRAFRPARTVMPTLAVTPAVRSRSIHAAFTASAYRSVTI